MKCRTAEYWREYRAKNRERILAQEKARREAWSPEKRAARLAYKKAWNKAHPKPRKTALRKPRLSDMTADERAAHRYAVKKEWYARNIDKVLAYNREWKRTRQKPSKPRTLLTDAEKRERKRICHLRWRDLNYQQALQNERNNHRRSRDKIHKGEYRPCLKRRIPEWVQNPAHARHLAACAESYKQSQTVSFAAAVQSGLTVGRLAV